MVTLSRVPSQCSHQDGDGSESKKEVKPILKSHLKKVRVLAADGSTAFQSSAKDLQMCSLKGVSHLKKKTYSSCQNFIELCDFGRKDNSENILPKAENQW